MGIGSNLGPVQSVMIEHIDDILTQWELTIDLLRNYVTVPETVDMDTLETHFRYKQGILDRWRRVYPRIGALGGRSDDDVKHKGHVEDVSD